MFGIETENVKLQATGNPIFLLDTLVTTNAYVIRPSQLRHLTARGRHHRNFEENKRLFADQKNMYFLPCTFCTPHLEITSFICYGSHWRQQSEFTHLNAEEWDDDQDYFFKKTTKNSHVTP